MSERQRSTSAHPSPSLKASLASIAAALVLASMVVITQPGESCFHVEDFEGVGSPARHGAPGTWTLRAEENRGQRWRRVAVGEGKASLTVDASAVNNDGGFQSFEWGPVEPYGAFEVRMRGAALPGYAAFIFTYTEPGDGTFDEIDIEVLADDRTDGRSIEHTTSTDLRLNSWNQANAEHPPDPDASIFTTIVDRTGQPVSIHDDGLFHTFTIDWHRDHIDFHVDGVLQGRLEPDTGVPDRPTNVIVGLRDLEFAGRNRDEAGRRLWTGTASLEIDYVRVCDNGMIG